MSVAYSNECSQSLNINSNFEPTRYISCFETIESKSFPITVYYSAYENEKTIKENLGMIERAYFEQTQVLRLLEPFGHHSSGVSSSRLSVFLLRGIDSGAMAVDINHSIWWRGMTSYLSHDPWGEYGGEQASATLTHELHHAIQAAYQWRENQGSFYEMGANFIQEQFTMGLNKDYETEINDFLQRPEWPIHYDDNYETYFMYGSWIYLEFLKRHYFKGNLDFFNNMMKGMRSEDETKGLHFIEALELSLPIGVYYEDTLLEFNKWRFRIVNHLENYDGPSTLPIVSFNSIKHVKAKLYGSLFVHSKHKPSVLNLNNGLKFRVEKIQESIYALLVLPKQRSHKSLNDQSDYEFYLLK